MWRCWGNTVDADIDAEKAAFLPNHSLGTRYRVHPLNYTALCWLCWGSNCGHSSTLGPLCRAADRATNKNERHENRNFPWPLPHPTRRRGGPARRRWRNGSRSADSVARGQGMPTNRLADAQTLASRCFRRSPERGGCVAVYVVTQGNRSPTFQRAFLNMVLASATSLRRFLPEARIMLLLMAGLAVQVPSQLSALINETRTLAIDAAADEMVCMYQVRGYAHVRCTSHLRIACAMPPGGLPRSGLAREAAAARARPVREGRLLRRRRAHRAPRRRPPLRVARARTA